MLYLARNVHLKGPPCADSAHASSGLGHVGHHSDSRMGIVRNRRLQVEVDGPEDKQSGQKSLHDDSLAVERQVSVVIW